MFPHVRFEMSGSSPGVAAKVAIVGLLFILQRFFSDPLPLWLSAFTGLIKLVWGLESKLWVRLWSVDNWNEKNFCKICVIRKGKWSQCLVVRFGDYVPVSRGFWTDLRNIFVMVTNRQGMEQGMLSLWRKFWRSGMYMCVWCIFHRCLSND